VKNDENEASPRPPGPRSSPELDVTLGVHSLWNRPATARVLVVASDAELARALEVRLVREGHQVLLADGARAAVEQARCTQLDVALVDDTLGDGTGLALLAELKRMLQPFEALLLSGAPSPELEVEALEQGAFDVLARPFSDLKLVTRKVAHAAAKVRAERDRNELIRLLHAQTRDLAIRETEAEAEDSLTDDMVIPGIDHDRLAGIDPLTGLPDRESARRRFRQETARALRYDRPLSIVLASIDGLEAVHERFGLEVQDAVIRAVSAIFESMVRDVDFIAHRQAGEFFVLYPETTKTNGAAAAERLRKRLAETSIGELGEGQGEFRVTASFGLAGLPSDAMNADVLWDAAEAALTRARGTGDAVVLFEKTMLRRR
jgi:diguanylate cyclase (GGDEF)-like protein